MKRRGLYILFSIMLATALVSDVRGQDAGMSDTEIVGETVFDENEKTGFVPGEEVRFVPNTSSRTPARDSIALQMQDFPMQQATMKVPEKSSEKQPPGNKPKDDSILTFNFLYYIIQKYKLQDIID